MIKMLYEALTNARFCLNGTNYTDQQQTPGLLTKIWKVKCLGYIDRTFNITPKFPLLHLNQSNRLYPVNQYSVLRQSNKAKLSKCLYLASWMYLMSLFCRGWSWGLKILQACDDVQVCLASHFLKGLRVKRNASIIWISEPGVHAGRDSKQCGGQRIDVTDATTNESQGNWQMTPTLSSPNYYHKETMSTGIDLQPEHDY